MVYIAALCCCLIHILPYGNRTVFSTSNKAIFVEAEGTDYTSTVRVLQLISQVPVNLPCC